MVNLTHEELMKKNAELEAEVARYTRRVKALEKRIRVAVETLDGVPPVERAVVCTCSKCGGSNVSAHRWANPNTDELDEFVYDDDDHAANIGASWCDDCEEHTVLRWVP